MVEVVLIIVIVTYLVLWDKFKLNLLIKLLFLLLKMRKPMIMRMSRTYWSYVSAAPARTLCSAPNQGRYCLLHGLTGARPPHIPLPHPPWQMVCGRVICPPMPPHTHTHTHTHTHPHPHPHTTPTQPKMNISILSSLSLS